MQTPKDLKKTVWAEALLQGIEIDRENKGAGPCWTFKILLAQSKLIKLFSCKHIKTMYYRCCIVDFEWGGSIYSECLFCKGLRKWSVIFFFFFPTDTIHKDHVIWHWTVSFIFLFAKIFFFFPDMFKNVSIFQEGWFHGFPWISRREYKWRKQQPSRLLWLIVIMKRFTEKVGYTCLLIVCFFAQISWGQEISEREPNSNTIYICRW